MTTFLPEVASVAFRIGIYCLRLDRCCCHCSLMKQTWPRVLSFPDDRYLLCSLMTCLKTKAVCRVKSSSSLLVLQSSILPFVPHSLKENFQYSPYKKAISWPIEKGITPTWKQEIIGVALCGYSIYFSKNDAGKARYSCIELFFCLCLV